MRTRRRRGLVVLATAVIAGVLVAVGTGLGQGCAGITDRSVGRPGRTHRANPPNIVFILSDDQRADTLWAMPNVRRQLIAHGVTFTHFYVTTPVCCPSRSSFLTGQYGHHTGVLDNVGPHGGAQAFDDRSTIATWLRSAGYTTGLFGKYLNGYPELGRCHVPSGWSSWNALDAEPLNQYYGFTLNHDGRLTTYPRDPQHYETDVLAGLTGDFIDSAPQPFFAYVAPSNPHRASVAAPQDVGYYRNLPPATPPSYDEADVSDKPWHRQSRPLGPVGQRSAQRIRQSMLASIRSLDRDVGRIVQALKDRGVLDNTIVVFASDNGFMWGEHRLTNKQAPYEESIRVPMAIRYDRAGIAPHRDAHLALNLDLAPTFAAAAGTTMPNAAGRNLLPLMRDQAHTAWRSEFLVEHAMSSQKVPIPSYVALHTDHSVYVLYSTGAQEYYDLANDPFQLQNLVHRAAVREIVRRMRTRVLGWARPLPPGFPDLS